MIKLPQVNFYLLNLNSKCHRKYISKLTKTAYISIYYILVNLITQEEAAKPTSNLISIRNKELLILDEENLSFQELKGKYQKSFLNLQIVLKLLLCFHIYNNNWVQTKQ